MSRNIKEIGIILALVLLMFVSGTAIGVHHHFIDKIKHFITTDPTDIKHKRS